MQCNAMQITAVEEQLQKAGIPYFKHAQQSFWEAEEVATALALLRLVAAPQVGLPGLQPSKALQIAGNITSTVPHTPRMPMPVGLCCPASRLGSRAACNQRPRRGHTGCPQKVVRRPGHRPCSGRSHGRRCWRWHGAAADDDVGGRGEGVRGGWGPGRGAAR